MPAIKARKVDASNMTTPFHLQQRTWNGSAYVWNTIQSDVFCEVRSTAAKSVLTGMMTIGALHHSIFTRFQPGFQPGMRLYNYVANTYLYIVNVLDVEQVHQWLQLEAVQATLDTQVRILHTSTTKGQYKQSTESTTITATVLAIFGEPAPGALSIIADRVGTQNFWAVGVPEDTVVVEGDFIQIVDTGEKFRVHAVRGPMSFKPLLTLLVGNQS